MSKIQQNFRQTKTYTKLPYSRAPSPVPLSKNIAASNTHTHTTAIYSIYLVDTLYSPYKKCWLPDPPALSPPLLLISALNTAGRAGGQDPPFKAERLTKAATGGQNLHASIVAPVDDTTTRIYIHRYNTYILVIYIYLHFYSLLLKAQSIDWIISFILY